MADPLMSSLLGLGAATGPSVAQTLGGGLMNELAKADERFQQPVQQLHAFAEQARLQSQVQRDKQPAPQVPDETSDLEQQQLAFIQDENRSPDEIQQAMGALRQRNMLTPKLEEAFQARLGSEQPVEQAPVSQQRAGGAASDRESRIRALSNFVNSPDRTMEDINNVQRLMRREGLTAPQLTNAVSRKMQELNTQAIRGGR